MIIILSDDVKYFLELNKQLPVSLLEIFAEVFLDRVNRLSTHLRTRHTRKETCFKNATQTHDWRASQSQCD